MPELLALDDHVGGRKPEVGAAFDVVLLAGRRIVERSRLVLRRGRRGEQNQDGGERSPTVHSEESDVFISLRISAFR